MKNKKNLIISMLICLSLFVSCSKDIPNEKNTNQGNSSENLLESFNTDDVSALFSLYDSNIDGAFAEAYSYNLVRIYKKKGSKLFVKELSKFKKVRLMGSYSY